ncbi:MAG: hypothetical protein ABR555_10580 [Pyrinomonadaceae bacterium]
MKKSTMRLLGGLALATGAFGAAGAYIKRKNFRGRGKVSRKTGDVWARPGMLVTFRAELMPGRDREERTFRVKELLINGRVTLRDFSGEHTAGEFDASR